MKSKRSPEWRKIRDSYLARHLYCEDCDAPASQVHHRIAVEDGGGDEDDNLMSLCRECHDEYTQVQKIERNCLYVELGGGGIGSPGAKEK